MSYHAPNTRFGAGSTVRMHVGMAVAVVVVLMAYSGHFDRHQVERGMADAGFGGQLIGKRPDACGQAAQKQGFHAVVMVQVHMHR